MKKEEIELIATRMAEARFPDTEEELDGVTYMEGYDEQREGFKATKLEDLPLHMESLRLLKDMRDALRASGAMKIVSEHAESHITSLEGLVKQK